MRPVLRYHGGKWNLARWIIGHFPTHRAYVEPFGGAASVLLQKPRSFAEVYNDLDGQIVSLFRVLRNEELAPRLIEQLKLTPFSMQDFKQSYEPSTDPVEQARRTILRSFAGFGSAAATGEATGFRANSNRSHSVPAHDWRNYPNHLAEVIERLRGVVVECRPAVEVIRQHDQSDTLFYADPPYVHSTRGLRRREKAYNHEMTEEDHRELATLLRSVAGHVVVSGYPSELYDEELFPGWNRFERKALADGARVRTEVLWISPRSPVHRSLFDQEHVEVQIAK